MKIFIDIGAYDGYEAKKASEDGYTVYSFDPNPKRDITSIPNVTFYKKAAWNSDGNGLMYLGNDGESQSMACSMMEGKINIDIEKNIIVETINIGKFLNDLNADIDILKIDAEGAEYIILESILNEFDISRIANIYVEDHAGYMSDFDWENKKNEVLSRLTGITIKPWIRYELLG